jgi:hypothetical protein
MPQAAPRRMKTAAKRDVGSISIEHGALAPNSFVPYNICANEFAPTFLDSFERYFQSRETDKRHSFECWFYLFFRLAVK